MKYLGPIIGLIIFLLLILVLALGIRSFTGLFTPHISVNTSSTAVVTQLKSLNRLETAQFTIEKVITAGTNGNRFQQLLFGDKILLIAHGEVIAGLDLSKLSNKDVTITNNALHISLPAPEILVTKLDNDQTRVYDRSTGLFTKGDPNLESEARSAAEQSIKEAACQEDILGVASKNAQSQLTALFKTLKFSSVSISIPKGSC